MIVLGKSAVLGVAFAAGTAIAAQAAPPYRPFAPTLAMASNYDPYTNGSSACPQGSPEGGPKCKILIPRTPG